MLFNIMKKIFPVITVSGILLSHSAFSEVLINQEFQFFKVRGETSQQIFRDFQKQSPIKAKGKYDATLGVAAIKLLPEVDYEIRGKKCHIAKTRVKTNIIIHLPDWENYEKADLISQQIWDRLFRNIKEHELTHAAIAKNYSKKLEAKIANHRPRRDCDTLDEALKKAAGKILAKHDKAQRKFDEKEYRRLLKR